MTTPSRPGAGSAEDDRVMPIVVGAIRSGTTLLRLMLDAHSKIAMSPETAFPETLFQDALSLPGEAVAARVVEQPKWVDLGIDRDAYREACRGRSGPEALWLVWDRYRQRHAKPIVGDKSPSYVRFLPSIARVLPGIRVIHLIRDGRDCFASQMHSRFSLQSVAIRSPARQASDWCDAVGAGRRDGPSLPAYLEIRYEDLVRDTAGVLEQICRFLGQDYEPAMFRYHERAARRLEELGDRVVEGGRVQRREVRRAAFSLTASPPDELRIGRWLETLLPLEVDEYEAIAGPMLAACGYESSAAILGRRDEIASCDLAAQSAAALADRDYEEARRSATRAFRADPRSPQRMKALMSVAEWREDLAVQWRMEVVCDEEAEVRFAGVLPAWAGEPLDANRRLFIWKSHRHLGAELRYSAALSNLGAMASHCTVEVDARLMPLVTRGFPAIHVVPRGGTSSGAVPPGTCFHATWERLAHYLLPSSTSMPHEPWLVADPSRVGRFSRRWIPRSLRPRVALVWHSVNADKSLPPLESWRHLLAIKGIEFVSAQHGADPRKVREWRPLGGRVRVEKVDLRDDLDGLAALLRSCDLLVACSASQVHLAGALGVPTWLLVREQPLLSWPLGRERTIWYPSVRCVWVRDASDWDPTMQRLADELRAWRSAWRRGTPGVAADGSA
jgi:hypothetical protein